MKRLQVHHNPFISSIYSSNLIEAGSWIIETGTWAWVAVSGRSKSGSFFAGMASKGSRDTSARSVSNPQFSEDRFQLFFDIQAISLNQQFVNLVNASDELLLVTKPFLALAVFRVVPKSREANQAAFSTEYLNNLNRYFFRRLSARRDIMLTQTCLNGIFCIRFAVGATRTNEGHIQDAYNIIIEEAKSTIETWDQTTSGVVSAQCCPGPH